MIKFNPDDRGSHDAALIQPYQEHGPFAGRCLRCEFLGAFVVVVEYANTDPPISCRAGKAEHFGGLVAAGQAIGQFVGDTLIWESANLYCPLPA